MLISLLLVHWGLLPSPLLYLSAYFERNRQQYYDRLLAVSLRGAWRKWITFFLDGVETQAGDAVRTARRLQDLQMEWRRQLAAARSSALVLRLADSLFERPVLTIRQAQEVLKVSYPAAKLNVAKLVKAGILTPTGPSPSGRAFLATKILALAGN